MKVMVLVAFCFDDIVVTVQHVTETAVMTRGKQCLVNKLITLLLWVRGTRSSVVELRTHDPKVVSSILVWAHVLSLSKAGKVTGSLFRGLATLPQQHYQLCILAQLLVKRRWASQGCTDKCPHSIYLSPAALPTAADCKGLNSIQLKSDAVGD